MQSSLDLSALIQVMVLFPAELIYCYIIL